MFFHIKSTTLILFQPATNCRFHLLVKSSQVIMSQSIKCLYPDMASVFSIPLAFFSDSTFFALKCHWCLSKRKIFCGHFPYSALQHIEPNIKSLSFQFLWFVWKISSIYIYKVVPYNCLAFLLWLCLKYIVILICFVFLTLKS